MIGSSRWHFKSSAYVDSSVYIKRKISCLAQDAGWKLAIYYYTKAKYEAQAVAFPFKYEGSGLSQAN